MNKDEMIELLINDEKGWDDFRKNCQTDYLDLKEADLADINFDGVDLKNTNLENANLQNSSFADANLRGANLKGTNLTNTSFIDADLKNTDLRKATIQYTELTQTDLEQANLQGANLKGLDLLNTIFRKANLQDTIFIGASLVHAILESAQLQRADLREANLKSANLKEANLEGANLQGANLFEANFQRALFLRTFFSSKSQLNDLEIPLTEEQFSNCIFEDEQKFYKKQAEETDHSENEVHHPATPHDKNSLKIHFSAHTPWTPRDLSIFLMGIQSAYSNLLYLHTTADDNLKQIKNKLANNSIFPPLEQDIRIQSIQSGSMFIEIAQLVQENLAYIDTQAVMLTLGSIATLSLTFAKTAKTVAEKNKVNAETDKIISETKKIEVETAIALTQYAPATKEEQETVLSLNNENTELTTTIQKLPFSNKVVATNPELVNIATKHLQIAFLELAKAYKIDPEIIPPKTDEKSSNQ